MPRNEVRVGISCLHYEWRTLGEAFHRAGELGFDLIEFSTTRLEAADYPRCAELSDDTGLATGLHAWLDPVRLPPEEAARQLREVVHLCAVMHSGHLVVHLGSHPERAVGLQRLAQVCEQVTPDCQTANVILCLENHYPYEYKGLNELGGNPDDFLPIFNHTDSPFLRFCLDYGHSHMAGNTEQFISRLGPWLAYTHIADNLGEHDDHLAPEDGTVNWPEVLRLTLRPGFRGPFVIEFPEQSDPGRFARFLQVLETAAAELA